MKRAHFFLLAVSGSIVLSNCSNSGGYDSMGPFDANGNYREDWADDPTKWNRPGQKKKQQVTKVEQPPVDATPVASTPPAPKPKPKPRPKPKPKTVRYTVKKGDSLYGISRKYGTSVGALQRANGISGSLIRPGQVLKIPR